MALKFAEFLSRLDAVEKALGAGDKVAGVSACPSCGVAIQESVTGSRKIRDKYHCSDCYYEQFGKELDEHPILMPRALRRA